MFTFLRWTARFLVIIKHRCNNLPSFIDTKWCIIGDSLPFRDRNRIDYLQDYLHDFWGQANTIYDSGATAQEAADLFDMRSHSEHYPEITTVGVHPLHALRAYELLEAGARE